MKSVYEAANGVEAHMVLHMLKQQGIAGRIDGEYLAGGAGDLPAMGLVRVMVDEADVTRAREIIREWERRQPATAERQIPVVRSRPRTVLAGLVGAVIGGGVVWLGLQPGKLESRDYDGDGRPEETYFFTSGGVIERVEFDRNGDGRSDAVQTFDLLANPARRRSDRDFDGHLEMDTEFEKGSPARLTVTPAGAAHPEYRERYTDGVLSSAEYLDASTGALRKTVAFLHGWPTSAQIDTDGDGWLETEHVYDRIGEIVSTRTLE